MECQHLYFKQEDQLVRMNEQRTDNGAERVLQSDFHPFVYGLYFKQIRERMMSFLKRITCPCKCKSATVAPLPQRNKITWMHPN